MSYIDGFVAAVPDGNRERFINHAKRAAEVFKENGALRVVECWGDDVPDGEVTSFSKAVQKKAGETIVFSWIVWPSRDVRNAGMAKAMADDRLSQETNPMPFDGKRAIFGGFDAILEL